MTSTKPVSNTPPVGYTLVLTKLEVQKNIMIPYLCRILNTCVYSLPSEWFDARTPDCLLYKPVSLLQISGFSLANIRFLSCKYPVCLLQKMFVFKKTGMSVANIRLVSCKKGLSFKNRYVSCKNSLSVAKRNLVVYGKKLFFGCQNCSSL